MTDHTQRQTSSMDGSSHQGARASSSGEHFPLAHEADYEALRSRLAKLNVAFDANWSGGQPAAVRMAHFPDIVLSLTQTQQITAEWAREDEAAEQATILVARLGGIAVGPEVRSISHGTRAVLILPGTERVHIRTTTPKNEYISAAFPLSMLPEGISQLKTSVNTRAIAWPHIAPLYNFIATTASASVSVSEGESLTLLNVVREVVSTMAALLSRDVESEPTLYDRAITHLRDHFRDSSTSLESLAEALGVSPRKVQSMFAKRGTTVTRELRKLRVAEAHRVRRSHPHITPQRIAKTTGFTSMSAMYRALRAEELH